jgi:hypothetical protein
VILKVACGMETVKRHWYRNLSFTVKRVFFTLGFYIDGEYLCEWFR